MKEKVLEGINDAAQTNMQLNTHFTWSEATLTASLRVLKKELH